MECKNLASYQKDNMNTMSDSSKIKEINIEINNLFPFPRVIIEDIYELYNSKKSIKERESALIDYIKLLFQRNK